MKAATAICLAGLFAAPLPAFASSVQADNGKYVTAIYLSLLARPADAASWLWRKDVLASGYPREAMTADFFTVPERVNRVGYPDNPTFVNLLYQDALWRVPAQAEVDFWVGGLQAGQTRAQVTHSFIYSAEFEQRRAAELAFATSYTKPEAACLNEGCVPVPPAPGQPAPTLQVTAGQEVALRVKYTNLVGASDFNQGQILVAPGDPSYDQATVCQSGFDAFGGANAFGYGLPHDGSVCNLRQVTVEPVGSQTFIFTFRVTFKTGGARTLWAAGWNQYWVSYGWVPLAQVSVGMPPLVATDNLPLSGGSKDPPAQQSELPPCPTPNCHYYTSAIKHASATQVYAEAQTLTVGPNAAGFNDYAKATLRDDTNTVVVTCAEASEAQKPPQLVWTTSRAPCSGFVNADYRRRYTVSGEHRSFWVGGLVTPTFGSYDTLVFMEAGTTASFAGIPMGSNSNFQTSFTGPPTVDAVVSGSLVPDGSTASYLQRNPNNVSISVTVPSSARRGLHQVTFPTTDIFGFAALNRRFSFIVYDRTPLISSMNRTSIAVAVETELAITGTGFGDRPTVFVGGTAYDNGVLSTNSQGQQVVTARVTLPVSAAGTNQQVTVRSNGSGGWPFAGAPLNGSLGSAMSNSMQVQAVTRPVISGVNAIWFLAGLGANSSCDPVNNPAGDCYFDTTRLEVTAPVGAAVAWAITGVPPQTTDASVNWGCVPNTGCREINLSSFLQPSGCGTVKVRATVNGAESDDFTVVINSPAKLLLNTAQIQHLDLSVCDLDPMKSGYCTTVPYTLVSSCGSGPVFGMDVNEELSAAVSNPNEPNNWSGIGNQGNTSWVTFASGSFVDNIGVGASQGQASPPPEVPGPLQNPPVALSQRWILRHSQKFRAGSWYAGLGVLIQQDRLTYFLDHGWVDEIVEPLP